MKKTFLNFINEAIPKHMKFATSNMTEKEAEIYKKGFDNAVSIALIYLSIPDDNENGNVNEVKLSVSNYLN